MDSTAPIQVRYGTERDREAIYRYRHDIFATELGQHPVNSENRLCDGLDEFNHYLVVAREGRMLGFVSITPPTRNQYSIDKYLNRADFAELNDDRLYEVRLLSVLPDYRHHRIVGLLMLACLRWIRGQGGRRMVGIGRREVLGMYQKVGFRQLGQTVQSGEVTFELMVADVEKCWTMIQANPTVELLTRNVDWVLDDCDHHPAPALDGDGEAANHGTSTTNGVCYHGGASITELGERLEHLSRFDDVINADVLDAWFPPPPAVTQQLAQYLPQLARTSPPTQANGLIQTIAQTRGLNSSRIAVGAGSSDLIFRCFSRWLNRHSRVLLIEPTYGEYAFVLEQVIGCHVDRMLLERRHQYQIQDAEFRETVQRNYDLIIAVNPNNPTGSFLVRDRFQGLIASVPSTTRVWIDECYVDYVNPQESAESLTEQFSNLVVVKSLSKVLALSGLRVGYLVSSVESVMEIRKHTPPWVVGMPGQLAAMLALQHPDYYLQRYEETDRMRREMEKQMADLGWDVVPGIANFFMFFLPQSGPTAAEFCVACRESGLYLRDLSPTSPSLGRHALRVAVKDSETNARTISILSSNRRSCRISG